MRQITVVVDRSDAQSKQWRSSDVNQEKYFFKNFSVESSAIEFISGLNEGLKVHKIFSMNTDGITEQLTIGFNSGRIGLITISGGAYQ